MKRLPRSAPAALLAALLAACSSNDGGIGPTIADLDRPIEFRSIGEIDGFHVEVEPAATFAVDREDVIQSFRDLVAVTADGGGSGDELRRLADLELEASTENRDSDDEIVRLQGMRETRHAIATYNRYLDKYPEREDNDLILYQLSRAYSLESRGDESIAAMDRLVAAYPESKYRDEVEFRRGEYFFVEQDFAAAEAAYGVVIDGYPDSIFWEKALYKFGWAQFKQGEHLDAQRSFVRLLDYNLRIGKIGEIDFDPGISRGDAELLDDAVRVLALSISYDEDNRYIARFFGENGNRDYEPLVYRKLIDLYVEKDRLVDAADLMLAYTAEYPFSAHTPGFHQRAIETYQQLGYTDRVLAEKTAFVERYDVAGDYWVLQEEDTRGGLAPVLVTHLGELATHFHAAARESGKAVDYDTAAGWYRRYLKSFPDDGAAPRMNFLLAESLSDAGQHRQATAEYLKTAYDYPRHDDSAEAGYAALLGFDAQLETAADDQALRERRFAAAVRFTTTFPGDERLPAVELQTAQQYYAWKRYDDAIASAERLLGSERTSAETRPLAWAIVADSRFSTADYPAAEQAYLALAELQPPDSPERRQTLEQVAASIYRQGELAREAGELLVAAGHFSRLGQVVPQSDNRIVADYDAASIHLQLEDWPTAIAALETFRRRYPPDNRFNTGVTEKLALAYGENGNQPEAAREMLTLARLPGDPARQRDLMWRAGELFENAGRDADALGVYREYVRTYPFPLDRSMELRHKIAESYRAAGDTRNLRASLRDIVDADSAAGGQSTARSKYLAATATLELTGPLHASYRQARLTVPLKQSLRQKRQLMEASIESYTRAMSYQVQEVTTEATYQIADIYHDFARSLMDSQRPKGLTDEQLEEYELLLEEQAFPFEEKAIDIHLANFRRIPAGVYDQPIRKSLDALGKLLPFRFARAEMTDTYVDIR